MPFSPQEPAPHNPLTEAHAQFSARESRPQDDDQLEGLFSLLRDFDLERAEPKLDGNLTEPPPLSPPIQPSTQAGQNGKAPAVAAPDTSLTAATDFDLEQDFWQSDSLSKFTNRITPRPVKAVPPAVPLHSRPLVARESEPAVEAAPPAPTVPVAPSTLTPEPANHKAPKKVEDFDEDALERLRNLFSELLLGENQTEVGDLETRFQQLEQQIRDPNVLSELLLPQFAALLARKVDQAPEEVIQALAPIVDCALARKSQTDKAAVSLALAAAIPGALSKQIGDAPEEIVQAIAPVMGRAMHEQVRLERDAMVDALYPVIGNTVSKYMTEVVRQINQRVEETFSLRGIYRKLRARLQGISEAELILSEALPFSIQAVFLIHKASGLAIVEVQREDSQVLEADMLAGMLTAIRSFASEFTVNPEKTSELTEIDYDDFKIVMEVAGYCYIAAITQGDPPASFATQLRQTLSTIILNYGYGDLIAEFNGNPDSIPQAIRDLLENLIRSPEVMLPPQRYGAADPDTRRSRFSTAASWSILLSVFALPLILYGWQQARRQQIVDRVAAALDADPNLTLYQLDAEVAGREVRLQGQLPNEILSQQAQSAAAAALPERLSLVNQIQTVNPPPDPGLIQAEMQRLTQTLNQMQGTQIDSRYDRETNRVMVEGNIHQGQNAEIVTQAFERIPGVEAVTLMLATAQTPLQRRIYFDTNSNFIDPFDLESKLMPIRSFLNQYPDAQLRIIGHTDSSGSEQRNQELAPERAEAVKQALIEQGIAPNRLQTAGSTQPPPDVRFEDPLWLSRAVHFEPVAPTGAN